MRRHGSTLSAARGAITALGLGERTLPDPQVRLRLDPWQVLPRDLTGLDRRLALAPARASRPGLLRWHDVPVRQTSEVTCGALALLLQAALGDRVLAAWLTSGRRIGSTAPPELRGLSHEELRLTGVADRLAAAERSVHEQSRRRSLAGWDWPRALGTPPWGAARSARFRGLGYTHTPVDDHDVPAARQIVASIKAATQAGVPVPLYTGGDLSGGLTAAVPRHVVLALPYRNRTAALRIFEPSQGRVHHVGLDLLLARTRPHQALGGWSHLVWAVLPEACFPAPDTRRRVTFRDRGGRQRTTVDP